MDFAPILNASTPIQIHIVFALMALILGPVTFFRRRRDRAHKIMGYTWVLAMAGTALSSFWIHEARTFGPFSVIHILSFFTFYGLYQGVRLAGKRNIPAHMATMRQLYTGAMGIAGTLTFLPGRRMNRIFAADEVTVFMMAMVIASISWYLIGRQIRGISQSADVL